MAGSGARWWVKWSLLTAKIVLSVVLMAWALSRVQLDHVRERVGSIDIGWLVAAALMFALSNVLGAAQWGWLLRLSGAGLPFRRVLSFYWVGLFFSNLLPANVGGDVIRVVDVSRSTGSRRAAVGATLLDRLLGFVAIALLALLALPLLPRGTVGPWLFGVVLAFSAATLFLSLTIFVRGLFAPLERLFGGIRVFDIGRRLTAVADELHAYRRHPASLLQLFSLAVLVQVMRIGVHLMMAKSLGIRLSPVYFFVIVPILAIVVVLPISVAGLGVRESAAVGLFGHVGLSPSDAVAHQLATFLICLAINMIGGILFVARSFGGAGAAPAMAGAENLAGGPAAGPGREAGP
ncbi:MAG: lysylphosphatidylglycerol synthase transmembrane domain-containing protein [Candidatus Eisenbacteria bacterium]|nr:lysylphosphatidylglycerol synthase transmembrane domain-containing protein [Candidatus Eisenbacteria bacterium]